MVLGLSGMRYWGDENLPLLVQQGKAAYERELSAFQSAGHEGPRPSADHLAVSGGGADDAFGAGLLVAVTRHGPNSS
jgi:hypothetical protein